MITQAEYRFAHETIHTEAFEGLKYKDLPAWAREILDKAYAIVEKYEQQEYARKVAENPDYFPF